MGTDARERPGGVVVGLASRAAVRAAYADLVARLAPPAVSVEVMADVLVPLVMQKKPEGLVKELMVTE